MNNLLKDLGINYLLVNSTNEYLVEYSALSENARYTLTGFSGSTGDALLTEDNIYLFVDGRYHTQADNEAKEGVNVIKLQLGQKQDEEIKKLIDKDKVLDFSRDCSSKIWAKLYIDSDKQVLFENSKDCDEFLRNFDGELLVDKASINAHDYALIKEPIHNLSPVKQMKAIKSQQEIEAYKKAFERTDMAVQAIRDYIESNENLSEYDIAKRLREEFMKYGAKSLSFNSIVAIDKNSALAHYSKNSKDIILKDGSLVLIDCGAYYESGLATDITRVFVKGQPSMLQKRVYTTVLKAFLNAFNRNFKTGYEYDALAHSILDDKIEGFTFGHGLGHGLGINVHEAPPALNKSEIAHTELQDGMCFSIEPGLYNPDYFGVRLENSCYKKDGKIHSFVKMGYEGKLIDYNSLSEQEKEWLKDFEIL